MIITYVILTKNVGFEHNNFFEEKSVNLPSKTFNVTEWPHLAHYVEPGRACLMPYPT